MEYQFNQIVYPNNVIYGSHLFLLSGNEAWESEASHVGATCLPNKILDMEAWVASRVW